MEGWSVGEPVMGFIDPFQRAQGTLRRVRAGAGPIRVPAAALDRRPPRRGPALRGRHGSHAVRSGARRSRLARARERCLRRRRPSRRAGREGARRPRHRGGQRGTARLRDLARSRCIHRLPGDSGRRSGPADSTPCSTACPACRAARTRTCSGAADTTPARCPGAATYTIDPVLNRLGRLVRRAVMLQPSEPAMRELVRYVEQGRLRCEIAGDYALEDTTGGHRRASRAGSRRGQAAHPGRVTAPSQM